MSTRLTNASRELILNAAMQKTGFPQRIAEAKTAIADLKFEMIMNFYGGSKAYGRLEDRIETVNAKVKDLADADVYYTASMSGYNYYQTQINIAGQTHKYPRRTELSNKYKDRMMLCRREERVVITADNPLVQKFYDAEAKLVELTTSLTSIQKDVKAVLDSVNTTKRLVEVWPEAAELIPADVEVVRASVPAINFTSLNAAIGIPSKKK